MGFTYPDKRGEIVWSNLPEKIDILITHGPPSGILDVSIHNGLNVGCAFLRKAVLKIQPKVHIFGHIH
jgi:Icc-related predicted phosphoesterase